MHTKTKPIPASRLTMPTAYVDPVRMSDRVLLTCRGIAIGGAVAMADRPVITRHRLSLQVATMSRDALFIQAALLEKRTAHKARPTLLCRVLDATVRPFIAFC